MSSCFPEFDFLTGRGGRGCSRERGSRLASRSLFTPVVLYNANPGYVQKGLAENRRVPLVSGAHAYYRELSKIDILGKKGNET